MNIKKIFILVCVLALSIVSLCGCNRSILDTTYKFDRAIIVLPDGVVIEGEVQSWKDYEDGDQIQVKMGGITYLVHSTNCVLIAE